MESLPQIAETATTLITSMLQMFVDNLPAFLDIGIQVIGSLVSGIASNLPSLLTSAASAIISMAGEILSHLPELIQSGIQLIGALVSGIAQAGPDILTEIGRLLSQAWNSIKQFDWIGLGRDIINGIVQGIKNFGGSIGSALGSAAKGALGWAKSLLKIGSPSKVFRDEIGQWIPEGIAVGIEANTDSVTDAMARMSNAAVGSWSFETSGQYGSSTSQQLDPIIAEIKSLKEAMMNLQVVLDTGATVGGLAPAMDAQLGSFSVYKGRGN